MTFNSVFSRNVSVDWGGLSLALKFVSEDVTDGAIRQGQTAASDVAYLLLFSQTSVICFCESFLCMGLVFIFIIFFYVCPVRRRRSGDDISLSLSVELLRQRVTEGAETKHGFNDEKQ